MVEQLLRVVRLMMGSGKVVPRCLHISVRGVILVNYEL